MNKRVVYLLLLISIISTITITSNVQAQSVACLPNQTIIYLSSSTNAHGAAANATSGYSAAVCYDQLFGTSYQGDSYACNGINKVVRLNGLTNAHAEEIWRSTQGYTDICFGNLQCRTVSGTCSSGEVETLRLYSNTNSHLALPGTLSGSLSVCCKIRGNITEPYWADLGGQAISTSNVGNTVAMIVPGQDLNNQQINYTVEKKSTSWIFFTTWTGKSSYQGLNQLRIKLTEEGTFRFRARLAGQSTDKVSAELEVSADETNNPPIVSIKAPIDAGVYFLNQTLLFRQESSDSDDAQLTYLWNFGDGRTSTEANPQAPYNYQRPGQKTITLRVTDARGLATEVRAEILIINSTYGLAYISTPKYKESITGLDVKFDASIKSYMIDVTYNPLRITCVAGTCPNQTADGQHTILGTPATIQTMNFLWQLSDGYSKSGNGEESATVNYRFTSPGQKSATMNISINGNNASTWANFTLYLPTTTPYCTTSASSATWTTSTSSTSSESTNAMNDCYRAGGYGGVTMCCPSGHTCTQTGSQYKCLPGGANSCSDYKTRTACESAPASVAKESVKSDSQGNITCGEPTKYYIGQDGKSYREVADNCRCIWSNTTTSCNSAYDTIKECTDGSCRETIGSCSTTVTLSADLCSTTQKVRKYEISSVWTGSVDAVPTSCRDGIIEKGCVDFSQIKLPFFGYAQSLIAIIMIIAFYYFRRK
jgi:hypothetical protein